MPDLFRQNDPHRNRNFNRLWESPHPLSLAEERLAELRRIHGNAAGTKIFRTELPGKKSAWL